MNIKKQLQIIGAKNLDDFETKVGQIPEDQKELANKLKDMVLFCLLAFEKNYINEMVFVAFSANNENLCSVQTMMQGQFKELPVPNGAIIACNFPVELDNLKDIFEKSANVCISGLICPKIDKQAQGFLLNHNKECFIFLDKILSNDRDEQVIKTVLGLNGGNIPKLTQIHGVSFAQQIVECSKDLF